MKTDVVGAYAGILLEVVAPETVELKVAPLEGMKVDVCRRSGTPMMVCANPLPGKKVPWLESQLQIPSATSGVQHQRLFPQDVRPPPFLLTGSSTLRQHNP